MSIDVPDAKTLASFGWECRNIFSMLSKKMLTEFDGSRFKSNHTPFEINAYILFWFDLLFSKNPNRQKAYKVLTTRFRFTDGGDKWKVINSRLALYADVFNGFYEPRCEFLMGTPLDDTTPIQKVTFVLGDILYNPACAFAYKTAPIKIDSVLDSIEFAELFLRGVAPHVDNIVKNIVGLEKKYAEALPEIPEEPEKPELCLTLLQKIEYDQLLKEIAELHQKLNALYCTEIIYSSGLDKPMVRKQTDQINSGLVRDSLNSEFVDKRFCYKFFELMQKRKPNKKPHLIWFSVCLVCIALSVFVCLHSVNVWLKSQAIPLVVTASVVTIDDNSVGGEWNFTFSVSGTDSQDYRGAKVYYVYPGCKLKFITTATENDTVNDVETFTTTKILTVHDVINGFSSSQNFEVTENRGRYTGNKAKVRVRYTFQTKMDYLKSIDN